MAGIKIFISYRHVDSQEDVYFLYERLTRFFGNALTLLDDNHLNPGDNFFKWIERSVRSCDVVLVIIGKNWLTVTDEAGNKKLFNPNDFVVMEISNAIKYEKKIIPLILPGASIPTGEQLPEVIKTLAQINSVRLPNRTEESSWASELSQVISSIEKDFPFYKDLLFWVMAFILPVVVGMAAFYSQMLVHKIAAQIPVVLPPLANEFFYFLATGIAWAGLYIVMSAKDYTLGKAGIVVLPLEPYTEVVEGASGFFNTLFLSLPLNIFFSWLIADTAGYLVFTYLHFSFQYAFLIAYTITSYIMMNSFSSIYSEWPGGGGRHKTLYASSNKYESFANRIKREEQLQKAKLRAEKSAKQSWGRLK